MNISLLELEPRLIKVEIRQEEFERVREGANPLNYSEKDIEKVTGPRIIHVRVEKIEEAQGVAFLCPKCFIDNGGKVGTHGVIVGFRNRGAPAGSLSVNSSGQDSRWDVEGTGLHDLTLNPSILMSGGGCGWHGFVRNGRVTEA